MDDGLSMGVDEYSLRQDPDHPSDPRDYLHVPDTERIGVRTAWKLISGGGGGGYESARDLVRAAEVEK